MVLKFYTALKRWKGLMICAAMILSSCQSPDPEWRVEVRTGPLLEIGSSTCTVEGEIIQVGESGVSSHGFVWSEQPDPTLDGGWSVDLGEAYVEGVYSYTISGLTASKDYYVSAYAIGGEQIVYGEVSSFTTGEADIPTIITFSVFDLTATGGFSGGNITDNGGDPVDASGICWSTGRFPDLNDTHTNEGGGHDSFESYLHDLNPYTVYYVRAYATNGAGTGYGQEVAFRTYWDNADIMDWDGNSYPTIQIGERVWTAVNLRATHYADGTPIAEVISGEAWSQLETDARAYCYYDNNAGGADPYGVLYTWGAAVNGSAGTVAVDGEVQGVCPDGWHLPGDEDWKELELELGMTELTASEDGWRGWDEGGMLKTSGTEFWNEPNEMATNVSGFGAVAAGSRDTTGACSERGNYTAFWSATEAGAAEAWVRGLHTQRGEIRRVTRHRKEGYSVRCIMDE
jgi:uncharacterized protein (TIGR02145 family)